MEEFINTLRKWQIIYLVNLDLSVIELVIIWGGITYMGRTYMAYVFQIYGLLIL